MKKILNIILLICLFAVAKAQPYGNEWISYNKTYYKFKVGKTSLYRINYNTLTSLGIPTSNLKGVDFKLFRNGNEVPLYVTTNGQFSTNDFIEFYGEMNDGKPDSLLYKDPNDQPTNLISMFSDSAVFFLTIDPASINARITQQSNDVLNVPNAEQYCYYTSIQFGVGNSVGLPISPYYPDLHNSDFDIGEGMNTGVLTEPFFTNLLDPKYIYKSPSVNAFYSTVLVLPQTTTTNLHRIRIWLNSFDTTQVLYGPSVKKLSYIVNSQNLNEGYTNFSYLEEIPSQKGKNYFSNGILQYPRLFNADNQSKINFSIKKPDEVYFEFRNFNSVGSAPILYDLDNKQRYVGIVDSVLKFHLNATANNKEHLYISSQATNDILLVGTITPINFTDFTSVSQQGSYLIISNKKLKTSVTGLDYVEEYRKYRSTSAGGNFVAKTYFIDELTDQFGYGIPQHPLAIRNFINYAIDKFSVKPKMAFIIGKGYEYITIGKAQALIDQSLVPTYGWPASDNLLTARNANLNYPQIGIGRLAAVKGDDIRLYLEKVKEYEQIQNDTFNVSQTPFNKLWMKNILHLGGGNNNYEQQQFRYYLDNYKNIIEAPRFGGNVSSLFKNSTDPIQIAQNLFIDGLINTGVSLITFFGHASTSTLDFNLEPETFNNRGRYHLMLSNGCFVGSVFGSGYSYSERFVLADKKAAIGYIAPTTYAVASNLNAYSTEFYNLFSNTLYNHAIGDVLKETSTRMALSGGNINDMIGQQMIYHGDPGLRINTQFKPDYYIDQSSISFEPQNINAAADSFLVKVIVKNLGAAVADNYVINIDRIFPNGQIQTTKVTLPSARYIDTVLIWIRSDRINGPGLNTFRIKVDYENTIAEYSETNNEVTVTKLILADDIIPIYPYEFCIVNNPNFELVFSTADPFATSKSYIFQIDTTEFFNSPLLTQVKLTQPGATIHWKPNIPLIQNKVYYWRGTIDTVSDNPANWKTSSFLYNTSLSTGWNQSHYFQYLKNTFSTINLKNDRIFYYPNTTRSLSIRNGYIDPQLIETYFDGYLIKRNAWARKGFMFFVYDGNTGKNLSTYQIGNSCRGPYNDLTCSIYPSQAIEFITRSEPSQDPNIGIQERQYLTNFLNSIPCNSYVLGYSVHNAGYSQWTTSDSLFRAFENLGVTNIRQQQDNQPFVFFLHKCDPNFSPIQIQRFIPNIIDTTFTFNGTWTKGTMTSPIIGPAKDWTEFSMDWNALETTLGDKATVDIYGFDTLGNRTLRATGLTKTSPSDITSIDPKLYPFLQMEWKTADDSTGTPPQMDFWRLTYSKAPEAVVNPTIFFSKTRDTIASGENFNMQVAVENVTPIRMDSLLVKFIIKDASNNVTVIYKRFAPLPGNQSYNISFDYTFAGFNFFGLNYITVEVNPDDDQIEQFHFNNFAEFTLYVERDKINPLLDVTFDGRHITDGEYVSANPEILFRLKDENKYLLLNDTSEFLIYMYYPSDPTNPVLLTNNQADITYIPATTSNNGRNNEARLIYKPTLTDGTYEIRAQGIDRSKNDAGKYDYRIKFKVDSKPSITNVLNYPNPFSTSTQFVFTLTGANIPEQLIIQIFSATGKVVKEITREQLGNLHVGTNVTDYKWDGTDNFGDRLANGVYFYRVMTRNMDGTTTEVKQSSIDKYFKHGYGKLYIIR